MLRYLAFALVLLAAAAASASLAPGRARQEGVPAETARIERRLDRIEARVLGEDAEFQRMNQALGAELLAAMEAARPGVADDARRLAELRARSAAGGGAAEKEAAAEVRRLEARVEEAMDTALRQPRLSSMVDAFNHLLREKMIRADPRAARLFERYAELHGRSAAAVP